MTTLKDVEAALEETLDWLRNCRAWKMWPTEETAEDYLDGIEQLPKSALKLVREYPDILKEAVDLLKRWRCAAEEGASYYKDFADTDTFLERQS